MQFLRKSASGVVVSSSAAVSSFRLMSLRSALAHAPQEASPRPDRCSTFTAGAFSDGFAFTHSDLGDGSVQPDADPSKGLASNLYKAVPDRPA
ncbi:MAG: hypothetical protein CMO55_08050 [Verrucomicrobiales bacterium]|nr:hypothetical protein [Verrucomicrobiales bacterium]